LPPDEQRLFRSLSVFAGGWRRAAAAAVAGSGDDQRAGATAVVSLVEASLVRRQPLDSNESRWTMLESIREFGRERLDVMGEGSEVRERHAKWCLSFVNSAANELKGRDQTSWLDQLELEHDNARLAELVQRNRASGSAAQPRVCPSFFLASARLPLGGATLARASP
jgi:predicted ATPase